MSHSLTHPPPPSQQKHGTKTVPFLCEVAGEMRVLGGGPKPSAGGNGARELSPLPRLPLAACLASCLVACTALLAAAVLAAAAAAPLHNTPMPVQIRQAPVTLTALRSAAPAARGAPRPLGNLRASGVDAFVLTLLGEGGGGQGQTEGGGGGDGKEEEERARGEAQVAAHSRTCTRWLLVSATTMRPSLSMAMPP
jgi:hypothetical protein